MWRTGKNYEVLLLGDTSAQIGREPYLWVITGNGNGMIHEKTKDNKHRSCQLAEALNMSFLSTRFEHPTRQQEETPEA